MARHSAVLTRNFRLISLAMTRSFLLLSCRALQTESAAETERIVGIGMTIEPKRVQRREDALRFFVLEREALDRSRFDGEAHELGDTAGKRENAPRFVNSRDVKVRPQ
jgi:hypothetical protein